MSITSLRNDLSLFEFANFVTQTIVLESDALRGNPLGDPNVRRHPVLVPHKEAPAGGWPVVFSLSGFMGNGPQSFNSKSLEVNAPQILDRCVSRGEAPLAVYVYVDAMTFWGGSQFVDSLGTGRYETHVVTELVSAIKELLPVSKDTKKWCVSGGSSGGYGALHLASRYPQIFGNLIAIAPDSFFEASIIPGVRAALPFILKLGGVKGVKNEVLSGRFMKRKEAFQVLDSIAMGLCYAPDENGQWVCPIDAETGEVIESIWNRWIVHDPIVFLRERASSVAKLSGIYLDVGTKDQFHLQYGTRQIRNVLQELRVNVHYSEFEGTHFEIGERRPDSWKWLREEWS